MAEKQARILVVHAAQRNSRKTVVLHVDCYRRYLPDVEVVYHHYRAPVTDALKNAHFDLVVLNFCALSVRTSPRFQLAVDRLMFLADYGAPIVAIPQDDFSSSAYLAEWLQRLDVSRVLTPRDIGIPAIYPYLKTSRTKFETVLPGYVDQEVVTWLDTFRRPLKDRSTTVATRVRMHAYQCGWFGRLKGLQAEQLHTAATAAGFNSDISTDQADFILGLKWFEFLASSPVSRGAQRRIESRRPIRRLQDPHP